MHRGRHKHGKLGAAVEEAFTYAFGRTRRQRAAILEKTARALARRRVERDATAGDDMPFDGEPPDLDLDLDPALNGVISVMGGRGRPDGPFAGRPVVRFVVGDADAARSTLPKQFRGFPVECATLADLESGERGAASQAQQVAPLVAPGRFGTVTRVFSRGGTNWVMTCSHVASPAGDGGDELALETGFATVEHFTPVASTGATRSVDVALASTRGAIDDRWYDGRPFEGIVAPASAVAPFTFFGVQHPGTVFQSFGPEMSVQLRLASGATVNFTGQHRFLLDGAAVEHGDSGGAVRDAHDRLVGVVVGRDARGAGYFTPIDRVEAWLVSLGL